VGRARAAPVEQAPVLFTPTTPLIVQVASNLHGLAPLDPYGLINPENWNYVEEAE